MTGRSVGIKTMEVAFKRFLVYSSFFLMYIWELIYFIAILMKKKMFKEIQFRKRYCCVHLKLAHFTRS